MKDSARIVYLVDDLTTETKPGIHATAYESIEKARANLDGFRAQHPDNPGPLTWTTGPGWASARDEHGRDVFRVFSLNPPPPEGGGFLTQAARSRCW